MKTKLFVVTFLLSLTALTVRAQENQSPKLTVRAVEGQPITVDFKDGREAVLKYSVIETKKPLSISFQIFDSLCSDRRGMSCRYVTPYRSVYYFLAWTKNPDATKINKQVRFKDAGRASNDEGTVEEELFTTGLERKLLPKLTQGLPLTQIACDDYSWLPGGSKAAPEKILIKQWNSELMSENPETDVSENRTVFSALNLQLTKNSQQALDIRDVQHFATAFGGVNALLVIGDVSTLTIQDSSKGLCSVEIKPSGLDAAVSEVTNAESRRTPPEQETNIYIMGQDESTRAVLTKRDGVAEELNRLIQTVQGTEAKDLE